MQGERNSATVPALLRGAGKPFIYKTCFNTDRLFFSFSVFALIILDSSPLVFPLPSSVFIYPSLSFKMLFFLSSGPPSLLKLHWILTTVSVFQRRAAVLAPPPSLSLSRRDSLRSTGSRVLSPATACVLEIPPSRRFKLHVSWLKKRKKKSAHTHIHRERERACLLQKGSNTHIFLRILFTDMSIS